LIASNTNAFQQVVFPTENKKGLINEAENVQKGLFMKFEFTTIELKENNFGKNDLLISKVKVMDDNGKYIKFARINEALLKAVKESKYITIRNEHD
jgi:hypothetical protein